jgi:hypothetical protein
MPPESKKTAGTAQGSDADATAQAADDSQNDAAENTADASNGEAPDPQAGEGTDDRDASDGEGESGDAEKPDAKLKRENQSLRRRLREAEGKLEAGDNAKLTELERATKDAEKWKGALDALTESLKKERLGSQVLAVAGKLGAIEPGAIAKMIAATEVEWDESGEDGLKPTNVAELVAAVKKDHPRLFSAAQGNGNGGDRDARVREAPKDAFGRLRSAYASKN